MSLEARILRIASAVLRRPAAGPELFKRLVALSQRVAEDKKTETDTDKQIEEAIEEERSDEPPIETIDVSYDEKDEEEPEDTEGGYFPAGALPQKERRKGPRPQDVKPGRPDWWNPR